MSLEETAHGGLNSSDDRRELLGSLCEVLEAREKGVGGCIPLDNSSRGSGSEEGHDRRGESQETHFDEESLGEEGTWFLR